MQNTWLEKFKALLSAAKLIAQLTPTKKDDEAVAAIEAAYLQLQSILLDPRVVAVIDWVINAIHTNPQLTTNAAVQHCPENLMAAANEAYSARGDGHIIALLIKILPILLAL